ncbi:MAG: hypothetical protein QOF75_2535 [Gaiellaceae bacterium]|nr:hypothetical protein [Gaiellaceae bacterium]
MSGHYGRVATIVHFFTLEPSVAAETMQRSLMFLPLKESLPAPPTMQAGPMASVSVSTPLLPSTSWFAAVAVTVPEPATTLVTVIDPRHSLGSRLAGVIAWAIWPMFVAGTTFAAVKACVVEKASPAVATSDSMRTTPRTVRAPLLRRDRRRSPERARIYWLATTVRVFALVAGAADEVVEHVTLPDAFAQEYQEPPA